MRRTLLCSAGTSVAQGCKALGAFQSRASGWEDDTSELEGQIRERLKGYDLGSETGRVKASAELNALHRLPVCPGDEVVLFATDTADGRCCAEAVREVLRDHFDVARVVVERVDGLQVRDRSRLREAGLINLTRQLMRYLDDPQRRYGGGCVLNTNGGFKGIVPFFAILGMIFRTPVVYVFEFAECLITLPPLPVGFATDLFNRALPAIQWAQAERQFRPEEFFRRIPALLEEERDWFGSFLEVIEMGGGSGALAGLSPLVDVLARRESEGANELWLSPEAASKYRKITGNELDEATNHLRKLSSPLWRSQHRATKHQSDLEFYPEERAHNPWRFAGFTEEKRFHLCWFTNQKAAYDAMIAKHQRAEYDARQFLKFDLPAKSEALLADDDPDQAKTWPDLLTECHQLRERVRETETREARTVAELRGRLSTVEARASRKFAAEQRKLEEQLAGSARECERLRKQIASANPSDPPVKE